MDEEEGKASKTLEGKRDADDTDKEVAVSPGVAVGSLRRKTASIGPTQGLLKWRRLSQLGSLITLRVR